MQGIHSMLKLFHGDVPAEVLVCSGIPRHLEKGNTGAFKMRKQSRFSERCHYVKKTG